MEINFDENKEEKRLVLQVADGQSLYNKLYSSGQITYHHRMLRAWRSWKDGIDIPA